MEFYWFFERATCGGPAPRTVTCQTGGATELAHAALGSSDTSVDHLLLRLNTLSARGRRLAGWTMAGVVRDDAGVGVHHHRLERLRLDDREVDLSPLDGLESLIEVELVTGPAQPAGRLPEDAEAGP